MKLHNDKEVFIQALKNTSKRYGIDPALIENDYFVTLVLKKVNESMTGLIFKGGTSLSKCYKMIDRFSEDIDLTLDKENFTQGKRKKLKNTIIDVCKELGLSLLNEEETKSRRAYNNYHIKYPISFPSNKVKPQLQVETVFIQNSYPCETKQASSFIGEWLREENNVKAIEEYEMYPFEIRVQSLERTLVDKVFAICDYMERDRIQGQSRHIYDVSRLITRVNLDENLKSLAERVREERKKGR